MTKAIREINQNSIKGNTMKATNTNTNTNSTQRNTMKATNTNLTQGVIMTNTPEQEVYTAANTKLFTYTGSKAKYQAHFDAMHSKLGKGVKKVDTYIEVFSGTLASLFHNLKHISANRIIINDFNPRIINLYKQIQANPKEVFALFSKIEDAFQSRVPKHLENISLMPKENREEFLVCRDFYHEARAMFNTTAPDLSIENAALFLFVANHNFNGMYTESKKSGYNVSFNWNSRKINVERIKSSIENLNKFFNENNVIFENMDAFKLIEKYEVQDTFIYLDPPYSDSTIQYKEGVSNFSAVQTHLNLIEACSKYKFVMYSNAHDNIFTDKFDNCLNFSRTNRISATKANGKPMKSNLEILAIKTNFKEPQSLSIKEIMEQFKEEFVPANVVETKNSVSAISPAVIAPLETPINNVVEKQQPLKVATAFSGIGAFEEAMKNIGINHENEFMIEINQFAANTYIANHSVNNVFEDITAVDPKTLPKIDVFVFGSPCQSFSTQGKREGLESTKGTLIYNGLQIIKETQPKYFIFENVKGLMNHDDGNTFKIVISAFKELDYKIEYKILNSKNFGAPQNRERLFIVGIRADIEQKFVFPAPQPVNSCVSDFISKGFNNSKLLFNTDNIEPKLSKSRTDIKTIATLPHIKYASDKRICSTNGISPTIRTSGQTKFFDEVNNVYRYLTPRELASIQGFKSDFKFPVSNTQIKKQIGNSITVGVLEALLKQLLTDYLPTVEVEIEEPMAA